VDASRDRKLARLGFRVVRASVELVLGNPQAAVAQIRAAL
jgi:very-short-patch-repair endonuclease